MTLHQLRYIVELSRHNSISAAAQTLEISQPSLSTAIKDLEKEFHITLLERNRHGISFTPAGLEFLHFANRIISQTEQLCDHFNLGVAPHCKLQLSLSGQHYMFTIDALTRYIQSIPAEKKYSISLREGRTSQVIQDVITLQSQIGILFTSYMTKQFLHTLFTKNDLEFIELCRFTPSVYINKNHPLAECGELSIAQLKTYPYIRFEQGQDSRQFSEEIMIPDIKSEQSIYVTDRSALFSIISATDAYTIGTGQLHPSISGQHICSIPLKSPVDMMTVGWIKLKNIVLPREALLFMNKLSTSLAPYK
jgi:DNA-binding transcriptional LysR family regulator